MVKILVVLSLILIPLWWIFLILWQPGFVHTIARTNSPAIERALEYATRGGDTREDIYFTPAELSHLSDVSKLYRPVSVVLNILAFFSWTVLVMALVQKIDLHPQLRRAAKILVGVSGILMLSLVFFSMFFIKFHELLFPQGNWQFPSDSMLITLFPETFWQFMLATILGVLLIFSLVYWILGKKR